MKLISLLPLNLREAEKEEKPADDAEGGEEANPFAGSDDSGEEGGGEEADADSGDDKGGEEKGDDKGDAKGKEGGSELDITFDASRVRKYNDNKFRDNRGTVVGVSRYGLAVKLADETTIFVNFEDIL